MTIIKKESDNSTLYEHPLCSAKHIASMATSHSMQQLDEIIKLAETTDPPDKIHTLLQPVQDNVIIREQHFEEKLKDQIAQILMLKLELSQANSKVEEHYETLAAVREELRGMKTDNRRFRREAMDDQQMIQVLQEEKMNWREGGGGRIAELERGAKEWKVARTDLQQTVELQKEMLFGLRVSNIAQRGEIHFLKQDIEHLKDKVEMNRAATDWLAENGPSLKADFFSLRSEVTRLRERGHQIAQIMVRGARRWERAMENTNSVQKESPHHHLNDTIDTRDHSIPRGSYITGIDTTEIDNFLGNGAMPRHTWSGKRRRTDENDRASYTGVLNYHGGRHVNGRTNTGDLHFGVHREHEDISEVWGSMSPDPR
ncbi:uncharacterized protein RAG0_11934 [Rhynchosporium agropyri]|uniref:Uncharacterized protein n=1 Tax=Rhynchosporium agropyri TaxID=914238 RepID=A0A1E1L688_9HELO|nr:uncharacterized protein RAG0_11934 [Rhynchosporium agropyri]